jgi:hypothetical protein
MCGKSVVSSVALRIEVATFGFLPLTPDPNGDWCVFY